MNKRTVALTTQQYKEIIHTMKRGFTGCRPNERIATALMLEANLGLRISDIIRLRLSDIVRDGERYRLAITEQKTGKSRTFTVPLTLYQFVRCYCIDHGIPADAVIFLLTERAIQKQLKLVCDYLDIKGVGTHSFRKFYATEIYRNNGYNIVYFYDAMGRGLILSVDATGRITISLDSDMFEGVSRDELEGTYYMIEPGINVV